MDDKFNTLLSIAVIPPTVDMIARKEGLDDISAINEFYHSEVYKLLCKEKTKVWHYGPATLHWMWKHEKETGRILYPEESEDE